MPELSAWRLVLRKSRTASFTLIELLTVMTIIAILLALLLYAGHGMWVRAQRSRAASEIQAMSTALEGYKTDNGIYPTASGLNTNTYTGNDGSQSGGLYQTSSQALYLALSGQTNFTDTPAAGTKAYMNFKLTQIGNSSGTMSGGSYVKDPWGYSYGYSTGTGTGGTTTNFPYNGNGFFDLWSTGGSLTTSLNTNDWISNWQQ